MSEASVVWRIVPSSVFARQMRKLDPQVAKRITDYLNEVAKQPNPRAKGEALTGDLGDFWKYRIGDYRVICEIKDAEFLILALRAGHRKHVYKTR